MAAHMNRDRLEVSRPDVVVVQDAPSIIPGPTLIDDGKDPSGNPTTGGGEPNSNRPRLWLALAGVLVLLAAGWSFAFFRAGESAVVVQPGKPGSGSAAGSTALKVTVEPPGNITAGKPARFTVNYEAGQGRFAGSVEEWGDGVGASSSAGQRACQAAASPSAAPLKGRYTVTHTWAEPGTYTVVLGVNTSFCIGDQPREETASRSLTVTVGTAP